jgi:magnesium transporter
MANLVADFSAEVREKVLNKEGDSRLEAALSYAGNTAGRLMNPYFVPIRGDVTIDETLTYLRGQKDMPANLDSLVVVARNNRYLGKISLLINY